MKNNLINLIIENTKLFLLMIGLFNYKLKSSRIKKLNLPFSKSSMLLLFFCIIFIVVYGIMYPGYPFVGVRQWFYIVTIPLVSLSLKGKYKYVFSTLCFLGICIIDEGILCLVIKITKIDLEAINLEAIIQATDNLEEFSNALKTISNAVFENNEFDQKVFDFIFHDSGYVIINSITGFISLVVIFYLKKYYFSKRPFTPNSFQPTSWGYILIYIFGQCCLLGRLLGENNPVVVLYYANYYAEHPNVDIDFTFQKIGNFLDQGGTIFLFLFLACYTAIGLFLIYNNTRKREYAALAEMNNRLIESQANYFQAILDKEMETRRFRHDISNHIFCMDILLKNEKYCELSEYLAQIDKKILDLRQKYQTGNFLMNAIVNSITKKYPNVTLSWTGNIPDHLLLSKVDTCTVFTNVLENAFQAASACASEKNVDVTVKCVSHGIFYHIENSMSAPINEQQGKLLTQKADKHNHGYGLANAIACVNRNEGSLQYSYTDNTFSVEIILPNAF